MSLFNNFCMLCIPTDVLSKVLATLPSSNIQLLERTVMVRHWHCFHLNYACIVLQNPYTPPCHFSFCKGKGPDWASGVRSDEYQLVCPGKAPMAVDQFAACHLALVPAHGVVTRPETRDRVVQILQVQQVGKDLLKYYSFFCIGHLQSNIYLHCVLFIWCFKNSFDYHVMLYSNGWLYNEVSALNQAKKYIRIMLIFLLQRITSWKIITVK